jgi:hypothetical protein
MKRQRDRSNFIGAIVVMVVVVGLVVWWVSSLTNEDPLWFLRTFNEDADWIVIYWDGRQVMLFPGDPGYDQVMEAFQDGVAHWVGYESGVGLSDTSLAHYREEARMLELCYNEPVQVHTRHLFPRARKFYVPLSGTHSQWHRVFAGLTDVPRIGVLNIGDARFERLLDAVEKVVQREN